jgi:transcriptional regulator GlxA family with amidase domain
VRSLQAGFAAHRGYSAMSFLRERRLMLARTRLLMARPGTTVAQIALSCGFEHLGRFSKRYRERFGENPSESLRRASPTQSERESRLSPAQNGQPTFGQRIDVKRRRKR